MAEINSFHRSADNISNVKGVSISFGNSIPTFKNPSNSTNNNASPSKGEIIDFEELEEQDIKSTFNYTNGSTIIIKKDEETKIYDSNKEVASLNVGNSDFAINTVNKDPNISQEDINNYLNNMGYKDK